MDQLDQPQWTATGEDRTEPGHSQGSKAEERESRWRRLGTWAFAVFCFFFFLILKLPEARIQNLVIAHMRIAAQDQGFLFSAEKIRLGIFLGPSLKIYNAELKSIENERQSLKIPFLRVRPKLLSLLSSVKKVGVSAELLDGSLSGTFGGAQTGSTYADLNLDSIDLSAATLIKKFLPVELTGKVDGSIHLELDATDPAKSEGAVKLKLEKLVAPAQNVSGFNIPKISVSESKIDIVIDKGKIEFKEFNIGKEGSADDLVGKVTGDGQVSRMLDRSTINAKAVFSLSQSVKQSFPLLDALLGPAKTPDGKYAYRLTGSWAALEPIPGG